METPRLERVTQPLHVPSLDVVPLDLAVLLVVQHQRHRVPLLPLDADAVVVSLLDLLLEELFERRKPVQSSRWARDEDRPADGLVGGVKDARGVCAQRRRDRREGDGHEENTRRRHDAPAA